MGGVSAATTPLRGRARGEDAVGAEVGEVVADGRVPVELREARERLPPAEDDRAEEGRVRERDVPGAEARVDAVDRAPAGDGDVVEVEGRVLVGAGRARERDHERVAAGAGARVVDEADGVRAVLAVELRRAEDVVELDGQTVETVQGATLTVNVDGDMVSLTDQTGNTVNVTQTDIEASNGVIHVIDGVLLPSS